MKIKYLDTTDLPLKYSSIHSAPGLEPSKQFNGKTYTLLGKQEKVHTFKHRLWLGLRALIKVLFSFGITEKVRVDWEGFQKGKKIVVLYSSSPFLSAKILADRGDSQAQYTLATQFQEGSDGATKNQDQAIKYFKMAANESDERAQVALGNIYLQKQDYYDAARYFKLAADQRNPQGQFAMGELWRKGQGTGTSSLAQAAIYYQRAADQGHTEAQYQIGLSLNLLSPSQQEGIKYFQLAANKGHAGAQFMLGLMYSSGMGVPKNQAEAIKYFQLAANQGHVDAQAELNKLPHP